ncbi:hypothetical protein CPAR01_01090 [Colletotrichum paranaense]|uniref:Uncharacterized protein n=1 Tax=Colletotrichum paranaense TaxID=1914294 RepID=A0ABQ9T5U2_9PEZI|nr:uncharacterized protein CPAR01_01090 [Colletotrichum paranaense]KAK1547123.1 hypothetical protein CPAR01_01090 [Colletotrichum paranaense]
MRSSSSVMRGNIAALNGASGSAQVSLVSTVTATGNSWNDGTTWTNASFVSVDASVLKGPRGAGGKVVGSSFLIPKSGAPIGATTLQEV